MSAKRDRGVLVLVGDDLVAGLFEAVGDGGGQDVGQQRLGALVLDLHCALGPADLAERVPDRGDDEDPRRHGVQDEARAKGPVGLGARVVRHVKFQGHHGDRTQDRESQGQPDVVHPEDQDDDGRRADVVEVHAGAAADVDG